MKHDHPRESNHAKDCLWCYWPTFRQPDFLEQSDRESETSHHLMTLHITLDCAKGFHSGAGNVSHFHLIFISKSGSQDYTQPDDHISRLIARISTFIHELMMDTWITSAEICSFCMHRTLTTGLSLGFVGHWATERGICRQRLLTLLYCRHFFNKSPAMSNLPDYKHNKTFVSTC